MKLSLILAFLLTAALYASVGFGGGSTYTALLAISGTPYTIIPIVSLICNICVVGGNSWRYSRAKLVSLSDIWPLLIFSVPAAFLGGFLQVSETLFIGLLSFALFVAGIRLVLHKEATGNSIFDDRKPKLFRLAGLGGAIGFYSGIVGIGGGIFLAPALYYLRWGRAKQIAAICSLFILVNSLAGLAGQLSKADSLAQSAEFLAYWPLILTVLVGGTLGNMISLKWLNASRLKRMTGVLILIVALRLAYSQLGII